MVESNLNVDFSDSEIKTKDFSIFRCDRNSRSSQKLSGGGVLIMVHNRIKSQYINITQDRVEQLYVLCQVDGSKFIIGGVYIPPQSAREMYITHCETVEGVLQQYPASDIYLVGDYNLPNAVWSNDEYGAVVQCRGGDPALEVALSFGYQKLFQHNTIPNERNVFLDLIFSNVKDCNVSSASDPLLNYSLHHISYEFSIMPSTKSKSNDFIYYEFYYDFGNGNYLELNNYLASINWVECLGNITVNEATNLFYEILLTGIAYYVPLKKYRTSTFPKWFSADLRRLTLEKKLSHSTYKKERSNVSYVRFAQLRSECKALSDICFNNYIRGLDAKLIEDPKSFWKYINDKRSSHNLPSSLSYSNREATSGQEIANLFRDFFQTVYTVNHDPADFSHVVARDMNLGNNINCTSIPMVDIFEEISNVPNKLSSGPDGIPNFLLKKCICTLVSPLHLLFNKSIRSSLFPTKWKESNVVPIFKSGKKDEIINYRSICIQSAIPKIFDCLVTKQIAWQCKGLISQEQHGFTRNKSALSNLAAYQLDILQNMEDRKQTDSVYTDFSKAFDRVDHKILLKKLIHIGFNLDFVLWWESSLSDRVQRVKIGCYYSDIIEVTSGVPQGGHSSPLLFNIFVNDIVDCFLNGRCSMFADDLRVWREIESVSDQIFLQEDLNRLSDWCRINNLNLNVQKCCFISFSRKPDRILTNYVINGQQLECKTSIRDLGVIFDEKLSFVEHINAISVKGSKMLGFILRNTRNFSIKATRMVYCSLVRSGIEYCSAVWSPFFQIHSDSLERIQHRFLRVCASRSNVGIIDHDYGPMERNLNLPPLSERRDLSGLIFLFKIISGGVDSPTLLSRIGLNVPYYHGLRNHLTFNTPFHRTAYGANGPINRYLGRLNNLNIDVFDMKLATFKRNCKNVIHT